MIASILSQKANIFTPTSSLNKVDGKKETLLLICKTPCLQELHNARKVLGATHFVKLPHNRAYISDKTSCEDMENVHSHWWRSWCLEHWQTFRFDGPFFIKKLPEINEVFNFLNGLLRVDPTKRTTSTQALEHPFLATFDAAKFSTENFPKLPWVSG